MQTEFAKLKSKQNKVRPDHFEGIGIIHSRCNADRRINTFLGVLLSRLVKAGKEWRFADCRFPGKNEMMAAFSFDAKSELLVLRWRGILVRACVFQIA